MQSALICMNLNCTSLDESCVLFTGCCWMGEFLKWYKQTPCGWVVVGTHLVLPLPPVLLWSSHPEKRNGFGGGLRSHLPQLLPCPFLLCALHRQCPSPHIHQVVSSQGQRASALLGCTAPSCACHLQPIP